MQTDNELDVAVKTLQAGGLIAYPTEAIYGIGCDPFNEKAVMNVYSLKQRPLNKGLILIASDFSQIADLIVSTENMEQILKTWPGPNTWVFPVTNKVPAWLTGKFNSLAVRVTDHPVSKALCQRYGKPIVSTSANLGNENPVKKWQDLHEKISMGVDYLVKGPVGGLENCSIIRNAITLEVLR